MMVGPCVCRYADVAAMSRQSDAARLTPRERGLWAGLHDPRRRRTWLAGRTLARQLVADRLAKIAEPSLTRLLGVGWREKRVPLAACQPVLASTSHSRPSPPEAGEFGFSIEIDSGTPRSRRDRPVAIVAGQALPWSLSIAHTDRGVLVAMSGKRTVSVGVDLVEPSCWSRGFVAQWFTPAERRWLDSPERVAVAWAVKEAVYKAINCGEPFRPSMIEVLPTDDGAVVCRDTLSGRLVDQVKTWKTRRGEMAVLVWAARMNDQ